MQFVLDVKSYIASYGFHEISDIHSFQGLRNALHGDHSNQVCDDMMQLSAD